MNNKKIEKTLQQIIKEIKYLDKGLQVLFDKGENVNEVRIGEVMVRSEVEKLSKVSETAQSLAFKLQKFNSERIKTNMGVG